MPVPSSGAPKRFFMGTAVTVNARGARGHGREPADRRAPREDDSGRLAAALALAVVLALAGVLRSRRRGGRRARRRGGRRRVLGGLVAAAARNGEATQDASGRSSDEGVLLRVHDSLLLTVFSSDPDRRRRVVEA